MNNNVVDEQNEMLQFTVDSVPDLIAYVGADQRYRFANLSYAMTFGCKDTRLKGRHIRDVIGEEKYRQAEPRIRRVLNGESHSFAIELSRADGILGDFEVRYSADFNRDGKVRGFTVTARDVTDAKTNQGLFQTLANTVSQLAWMAGPDGVTFWFNDRWCEYTGKQVGDLVGAGWQTVLDPAELPAVIERWRHSSSSGENFEMILGLRGRDGRFRKFLAQARPVRDAAGKIIRWIGTNTDIQSERDTALDLSLKSEAIENSLNGFDIVNSEGRLIYANKAYLRMWGYSSAKEVLGMSAAEHCADPTVPHKIITALKTEGQCDIEFLAKRKDGSTFEVRMLAFLARDAQGNEIYPTTSIDVTEQKLATEAVRSSEAHFRDLVDHSPAMFWITDANSQCTYLSKRWYDYTGRTPEQDLGVGWVQNVHPDDHANTAEVYTKAISERGILRVDYRLRAKDGSYRWMIDIGYPRTGRNGEFMGYVGTVTDIHDRVLAEKVIKSVTDRFQRSAKASDLGVWYCDLPFDYLEWNDECKTHFFIPLETRVTIELFYQRIHPDDRVRTKEAIDYSIANRAHYDIHYRTVNPARAGDFKWIRAIGWTDYDAAGMPIRFDGITLDATEEFRRNEELIRARDEAERANQLKSSFLANMSHEIRTPLGAMIGFADLLRDPGLSAVERTNFLDILARNGEQLGVIINDILDLSKVEAGHLNLELLETRPEQIVAEVISLMRVKAKQKDLALEYSSGGNSPESVISDPLRVKQVLLNLIGNAIKFTPYGRVSIKTWSRLDPSTKQSILAFEVEDTGIGIPREHVSSIFQMFVQADGSMTRRFGGTGLGLALSRKLARAMGGDVEIVSTEEGRGTTFLFTVRDMREGISSLMPLPRENNLPEPSANALKGAHILVVDDSPDNQSLIWLYLRKYGASLDSAENGLEGVKKAMSGQYDLILMDLQMPLMDGYTATLRLRQSGYTKPIIALTAHAMSEVRSKCLQVGCNDHLPKPIDPRQLVGTLAKYVSKPNNL